MAQGAPTLKRVHFELGGKNPVIVFDDADLDRALDAVRVHDLQPQRRALHLVEPAAGAALDLRRVHRASWPSASRRSGSAIRSIPATEIGPLIHPRHVDKVLSYIEHRARRRARDRVGGGARRDRQGQLRAARRCSRGAHTIDAHRAGGDLRPGADRDPVRRRSRCAAHRQRRPLRPRRLYLDRRRRPRPSRRAQASRPAWSGSIRRTCATCRRRSAA